MTDAHYAVKPSTTISRPNCRHACASRSHQIMGPQQISAGIAASILLAAGVADAGEVAAPASDGELEAVTITAAMITAQRTIDEIREQPQSVSAIAGEDL